MPDIGQARGHVENSLVADQFFLPGGKDLYGRVYRFRHIPLPQIHNGPASMDNQPIGGAANLQAVVDSHPLAMQVHAILVA